MVCTAPSSIDSDYSQCPVLLDTQCFGTTSDLFVLNVCCFFKYKCVNGLVQGSK